MKTARAPGQAGFTLIEAMIAMAMMAIGIVGVMQLQIIAARSGSSATRNDEGTEMAEELLTQLQMRPYNDPLLSDIDTTNDSAVSVPGYQLQQNTAPIDHCLGNSADWPAAVVSSCKHWDTMPGMRVPPGALLDGGQPMFYLGWDVEDALLRAGGGGYGTYTDGGAKAQDGKVIVSRVLWRDPALSNLRSASAVLVLNNPQAPAN